MKKYKQINPIVQETIEDFKKRQEERNSFENQWQLNLNFFMGNQYCTIGYGGKIEDYNKQFFNLFVLTPNIFYQRQPIVSSGPI